MNTWLPDPDATAAYGAAIRNRLIESLLELARACRAVVAIDEAALAAQLAALQRTPRPRPGVFLLYYDCLAAVRRDDAEQLASLLQQLSTLAPAAPALVVRGFADASLPAAEWERYQRALQTDIAAPAEGAPRLAPVAAPRLQAATALLGAARAAIAGAAPRLAEEIDLLTTEIIFAGDSRAAAAGFGGATSFQAWGAIFLNVHRHTSLVRMADGLVHEAAHARLLAQSGGAAMVANDNATRYRSPLRPDPRPMEGIFHASFVSARICWALDRLLASDRLAPNERNEAAQARDRAARAFRDGYATLCESGRPTPLGGELIAGAAAYMLG
jgi:hypothetical protein